MSIFSWFSGKSSTSHPSPAQANHDSRGTQRDRPSVPLVSPAVSGESRGGVNKSHRHVKREQLYTAVREAMIRAGVLSASYKFKVLSLDPLGTQFMVMMDLSPAFGGQPERLSEIELMIAQSAKSRYDIRVTAVYWRVNERVSAVSPAASAATHSRPAPLHAPDVAGPGEGTVAIAATPVEVPKPASRRYEPIQDDEVAAFKRALAAASAQGVPAAKSRGPSRATPRSYTLLTGFEDTEMPESSASMPALSATQYGDLN